VLGGGGGWGGGGGGGGGAWGSVWWMAVSGRDDEENTTRTLGNGSLAVSEVRNPFYSGRRAVAREPGDPLQLPRCKAKLRFDNGSHSLLG
jgi:hypothetical protein